VPRQKRHRDRMYQLVNPPPPGAVLAGYARYSSDMQEDATLITQHRKGTECAERHTWSIGRWYDEPATSAKYDDISKRPIFAEMLRDVCEGKYAGVIVYDLPRWSRNVEVAMHALSLLRKAGAWWQTQDDLHTINSQAEEGSGILIQVEMALAQGYVQKLSKRVIDGKEDRARAGYHNGSVMFGYLTPEYPKAPDGAPSTWKPPRMPVRADPDNFPALVKIGELAAAGWSDMAIADELAGHVSVTPRFGTRALTKDTVAAIRRSWFPREYTPGCGHGTIETPAGDLFEGKHPAAWPYELWQRMVEAKAGQYRRPKGELKRHAHEFSRLIVCAGCRRALRVNAYPERTYYRDTSFLRKLPCSTAGCLSVNNTLVVRQFGDLLASVRLPEDWRKAIAERCSEDMQEDGSVRIQARRHELEAERKRLAHIFAKGAMSDTEFDGQIDRIDAELKALPIPVVRSQSESTKAMIAAGETLADMAAYWDEAAPEERRDILWALLNLEGLVYDLERRAIVGLLPRTDVLPILALGLMPRWESRDSGLWLASWAWPKKQVRDDPHAPPKPPERLTAEGRREVRVLVSAGLSVREVARRLNVSRQTVSRIARSGRKGGDG
jgi:DNA invertase Pin-like site-specific DNA recombinase